MASQWKWDQFRQKYYYYLESDGCFIYSDGEKVYQSEKDAEVDSTSTYPTQNIASAKAYYGYKQLSVTQTGSESTETPGYTSEVADPYNANVQPVQPVYPAASQHYQQQQRYNYPVYGSPEFYNDGAPSRVLFNCSESQAYTFRVHDASISPVVCRHLFSYCERDCPEPWEHFHISKYCETRFGNPSVCLYEPRDSKDQFIVIDLGMRSLEPDHLESILKEATKNHYRHVLQHLERHVGDKASWSALHAMERKHFTWREIKRQELFSTDGSMPQKLNVSGIICVSCKQWTILGERCGSCGSYIRDELDERDLNTENMVEVAGGIAGGILAGAFWFVKMFLDSLGMV